MLYRAVSITTFALGAILAASIAHAQQPGIVAGRIVDQTGGALPGVSI